MNKRFIYLCIASGMLTAACTHHHGDEAHYHEHEHEEAAAPAHDDEHGAGEIVLTADKARAAGVVVDTVTPGEFRGVLRTTGKILSASDDENAVVATTSGIVTLSRPVTEGMSVTKGAALFNISSSKLPEGELTDRKAIEYETAKAEYERAESLLADRLIAEKEYLAIKAAYETARLAYEATGGRSSHGISVSTPVGGFVKELLVKPGDYVEVGQPLMTVTQNKHLYLRAEVPQRLYASLGHVTSAKFKTSYSDKVYDLADLDGRPASYGKSAASSSSFIPMTFEFNNCSGIIPGAYAEIYLLTGHRDNVISVPVSALTEEQGVYYLYIKLDDDCYRKQPVTTGESDGERVEITDGIADGDAVVTEGAIHVKLAAAGKSIPGHSHNH